MSSLASNNLASSQNDDELNSLLTRKKPNFTPAAPKCPKCGKSVYKAEEIRAANQVFHKLCFKCGSCNKLLESNTLTEHNNDLYCKSCYAKNFGPKGYGYGSGAGTLSMENGSSLTNHNNLTSQNSYDSNESKEEYNSLPQASQPTRAERKSITTAFVPMTKSEKCGRCNKAVYAAEKVVAAGHSFHKLCFTCSTCKKLLNSMTCCDNSDGEIFCKPCYGKQFGPKGVGYGIGAGTLQTN